MAASTGTLSALHEMLTEMFIQDIKLSIEEGIPMSASDKAVIVKFLKDNSITAEADVNDMQVLREQFQIELDANRAARAAKYANVDAGDELIHGLMN